MREEDLKWYSPFVFLVGAILSFADPITDILTLVEFYRADHKTWFGVGLAFVILPCLAFPVVFASVRRASLLKTVLCALHPFSAAFARVEAFIICLTKWYSEHKNVQVIYVQAEYVLYHIDFVVLFEAVLESAPQFIVQLYAISVQEEPAAIIQIISLPVSFLTLAWAFTATDKTSLAEREIIASSSDLKVKHQLALYVSYLLLLSSRLLAICYFTVSYKWWVTLVLMFHSCAVVKATNIQSGNKVDCDASYARSIMICMGIHCLRDDFVDKAIGAEVIGITMSVYFSHIFFVLENFLMILMFYFTYHPKAWYSLPVTVYVCVFSVLGSTMRICLLHWLKNRTVCGCVECSGSLV